MMSVKFADWCVVRTIFSAGVREPQGLGVSGCVTGDERGIEVRIGAAEVLLVLGVVVEACRRGESWAFRCCRHSN